MINIVEENGKVKYGIKKFILDSVDDITNLPTDVTPGSEAYVITTGVTYILNGESVWAVKSTSSSGGGSTEEEDTTELYSLQVEDTNQLYAYYPTDDVSPQYEYDSSTGDLYIVVDETTE